MAIDFKTRVHAGLQSLQPYVPGKSADDIVQGLAKGVKAENIVKLASNENPLGCSPQAIEGMQQALGELHRYPDGNAQTLKQAIQAKYQVQPEQIIIGNGSNEILELLVSVFVQPGDEVIVSEHAFAVYALATQAGATMIRLGRILFGDRIG